MKMSAAILGMITCLVLTGGEAAMGSIVPDHVQFTGDMNLIVSPQDMSSFALNMTILDVTQDMYKVFGYAPIATVHNDTTDLLLEANSVTRIYIGTPDNAAYLAELTELSSCLSGAESHCLRLVPDQHDTSHSHYWLLAIGADVRGAIYAAYTFSEQILGVDPMYRFTDIQPDYQPIINTSVALINSLTFASPQFEYRVIFANDEDLLGGFTPDPLGESVFSLTTFNWLYETTLRIKANAFLVGTVPYPDEKSLTLASRRGLVVTNHHFNLLGINTFRWPSAIKDEWSWSGAPATMAYAWKASISAMSRLDDVIWSVGYRGLNDYPAPCEGCSAADKGEYISQVIANQTQWVNQIKGANQKYMTYLWQEGLGYLQKGFLTLPEEVSVILTDSGPGHIFGLDDYANISDGVYTHVAMYNGNANQLTEMVPPSRHFDQLGTFVQKGRRTKYIILNTSDLRPVPLTTEAVMRFAWDPKPFMTAASTDEAQTQFITEWAMQKYGVSEAVAGDIAQLYNEYFQVPYIQTGNSDNHLSTTIMDLADAYSQSLQKTRKVSSEVLVRAHSAIPISLADVRTLHNKTMMLLSRVSSLMTADRLNFFVAHLVGQTGMQRYGCEVQNSLAMSIIAMAKDDVTNATTSINEALQYFDAFFSAQRGAETSHWRGVFMHSHLADFQRARSFVRRSLVALKELSAQAIALPPAFPGLYYTFTFYQLVNEDHYPLFYASSDWNMHNFVRISCMNISSAVCYNNATGGFFHSTANIMMKSLLLDSDSTAAIHYTLDGSAPTAQSPVFDPSKALQITQSTHIKAVALAANTSPVIVSEAVYAKV
ncbi:uncharacterized protein LOC135824804 [Sycon ciliatum]|uniref:uncharacterized protein LOC135824804 n=1 Tax=Sycon ciliatum TaxID=27933 RepID=UPI0031F66D88